MALNDDLKAWWMLNEESGTRYDAHGSNDLTDTNTVLYGTGKQGNAADFEYDNDEYLTIADNADLSFGDEDFTLACWVKIESDTGQEAGIMGKLSDVTTLYEYTLWIFTDDKFVWFVTDSDAIDNSAVAIWGVVPDLATWYFLVAWHDSVNDLIGISVNDGTPVTTAYTHGCHDGTANFDIGEKRHATGKSFDGLIDEPAVWGRVLTSTERTYLYNSGDGRTYKRILTPAAVSCIAASVAPQVRERIVSVVASAIAAVTAPQVRERVTNKIASAIGATVAPVVGIWKMLVARYHDYFLNAPQRFTISSNKVQMTARYHDYYLTAPQRERYG